MIDAPLDSAVSGEAIKGVEDLLLADFDLGHDFALRPPQKRIGLPRPVKSGDLPQETIGWSDHQRAGRQSRGLRRP
jgi:hypothetical protein